MKRNNKSSKLPTSSKVGLKQTYFDTGKESFKYNTIHHASILRPFKTPTTNNNIQRNNRNRNSTAMTITTRKQRKSRALIDFWAAKSDNEPMSRSATTRKQRYPPQKLQLADQSFNREGRKENFYRGEKKTIA